MTLYEETKRRNQALDAIDLLLKLRDLLRDDLTVRGEYQKLFDHLFVDEFQDTDPLQAEVLLYLCEQGPRAKSVDAVVLTPGKLTIVEDPAGRSIASGAPTSACTSACGANHGRRPRRRRAPRELPQRAEEPFSG
ncbi:MAG: UvrD-helicase domain-containing protein [Myxococcales bacterium]|nr:UvrD-helicase domain-containing protein [Myxococcales bacterium]